MACSHIFSVVNDNLIALRSFFTAYLVFSCFALLPVPHLQAYSMPGSNCCCQLPWCKETVYPTSSSATVARLYISLQGIKGDAAYMFNQLLPLRVDDSSEYILELAQVLFFVYLASNI